MYSTKILFIGIESAEKDLLLEWADAGLLPNIQKFRRKAAWGTTSSPPGLYAGAVWPSFYTGVSPAAHGRYCFLQLRPGSYELEQIGPSDVKVEPFWNFLSRAGKKVGIVDVPKTAPSQYLNGVQLSDWGVDDPFHNQPSTWPPALVGDLIARFGDGFGDSNASGRKTRDFIDLRDSLQNQIDRRFELTDYLLQQGEWDCFVTIFNESHAAGHQCWHWHDSSHPMFDVDAASIVGNPMRDIYMGIDKAIGKLLAKSGPDTLVFISASHGMGPHYDGTLLLDEILERLERWSPGGGDTSVPQHRGADWRQLSPKLRKGFARLRLGTQNAASRLRARGKCFQVPNNDCHGGIRINLIGREPEGKIRPGRDYDAFCEELANDLLSIVNLDTGEPMIRRVLRTDEIYRGKYLDHLPDLTLEWHRSAPIVAVASPKTGKIGGTVRKRCSQDWRSGDHKPDGLFFASGASVQPGKIAQRVDIMDFAPTIASYLGVELPHAEGQSLLPLLGI